jgi:hypothetical protein
MERVVWVDYIWKDEEVSGDTNAMVIILNNPALMEKMVDDESFDQRVWFYFQDEAEYQRAFDPNDEEFDFTIVREIEEDELDSGE